MALSKEEKTAKESPETVEDLNRILEIGRLLFNVLNLDEREELQRLFRLHHEFAIPPANVKAKNR